MAYQQPRVQVSRGAGGVWENTRVERRTRVRACCWEGSYARLQDLYGVLHIPHNSCGSTSASICILVR